MGGLLASALGFSALWVLGPCAVHCCVTLLRRLNKRPAARCHLIFHFAQWLLSFCSLPDVRVLTALHIYPSFLARPLPPLRTQRRGFQCGYHLHPGCVFKQPLLCCFFPLCFGPLLPLSLFCCCDVLYAAPDSFGHGAVSRLPLQGSKKISIAPTINYDQLGPAGEVLK